MVIITQYIAFSTKKKKKLQLQSLLILKKKQLKASKKIDLQFFELMRMFVA